MTKDKYSEAYVRERLRQVSTEAGDPKGNMVIERMAYEFGVNLEHYNPEMSNEQIIRITLKHQNPPSQLEKEMKAESNYYEKLRSA